MPTVADTAFADEWSPRNDKEPSEYSRHSRLKAWWRCALEHEWQARISHRHVAGCPTCSGRRTLAGYNDLATTHPDVAKEWHPTLNDLNSDQVGKGCIKQIWLAVQPWTPVARDTELSNLKRILLPDLSR